MERAFFEDLGISAETIDLIMEEVQGENDRFSEAENLYKSQIEELSTQLSALGNSKNSIKEDYEVKLSELQKKYDNDTAALKEKIEKTEFDFALKSALEKSGVKNVKALTGFLDFDAIKLEDGVLTGLNEQIEAVKEENSYLFGNVPASTGMAHGSVMSSDDGFIANVRSAAGI